MLPAPKNFAGEMVDIDAQIQAAAVREREQRGIAERERMAAEAVVNRYDTEQARLTGGGPRPRRSAPA
jgi:hypothetical protein